MKKILFYTVISIFSFSYSIGQCPNNEETKVLLVGDSWAFFMGVDGTINDVFENWGMPEYKFYTNPTIAENGATTDDFLQADKQTEIANQLNSNPSIEFVHLSISGNDLLGDWKSQSFTTAQTDSLRQQVEDSLYAVVDFIKSIRPDVTIVWGGYAYPNFEEVVNSFLIPDQHPFYGTWEDMEFPTNLEINDQLNVFEDEIAAHYASDPRVIVEIATGITQYTHGQIDPLEVAPFGTYPPFSVTLPYGDPTYPSPKESMRDYGITKDCFHLSAKGFRDLFGYITQKYYFKALMDDIYLVADDVQKNGSVAADGATSQDLFVGNKNNVDYHTILTFNTLNQLDSNVQEASIFLHRIDQTGNNPIDNQLTVSVKNGAFSNNVSIESADFTVNGDASGTPCIYGSNTDGNWVRIDLPQNMLEYISTNNITQLKISAPNANGSFVEFSGVSDPDFAPVLNIVYGNEATASIAKNKIEPHVLVFPNPTTNKLTIEIEHAQLNLVEIYSLTGERIVSSSSSELNIVHFASGVYIIHIQTSKGTFQQKVIKE